MKYIMRLDGKHRLLAAGARAETGSGKGGSRCRAGERAQSPSMRLSSGCMVGLLKHKMTFCSLARMQGQEPGVSGFFTLKASGGLGGVSGETQVS